MSEFGIQTSRSEGQVYSGGRSVHKTASTKLLFIEYMLSPVQCAVYAVCVDIHPLVW